MPKPFTAEDAEEIAYIQQQELVKIRIFLFLAASARLGEPLFTHRLPLRPLR